MTVRMYKRRKNKKLRRLLLLGIGAASVMGVLPFLMCGGECPTQKSDCARQQEAPPCDYGKAETEATPLWDEFTEPQAVACDDAVEGTWVGYQVLHGHRYRFTAKVSRAQAGSDQLVGTITSHYWQEGHKPRLQPASCETGLQQTVVEMNAKGSVDGKQISFVGQDWRLSEQVCGEQPVGYYPDGFTGRLSCDGTRMHTTNDDGHNTTTDVTFKRISCDAN